MYINNLGHMTKMAAMPIYHICACIRLDEGWYMIYRAFLNVKAEKF